MFSNLLRQFTSRKGDIWLLSAKWTTPVFGLVGGLVAARNLAPAELGVVQAVLLIPTYLTFLNFGVFSGLNRNLPLFRAKNEPEKAQGFVNASAKTARWVALAGSTIALILAAIFFFTADDPNFAYVAAFLVVGMIFAPLKLHQDTIYRGMRQFERLGKNLHVTNTWTLLCSLSTSVLGITGLTIKLATQNLIGWLLLLRNPPLKEQKEASFKDMRQLSAVGMPIMISGIIFGWLAVADRSVVATFLTAEDLGYFALAGIAISALHVFPSSINLLLYPRVASAYGKSGSSIYLRRYIWIGLGLNLIMMLPIAIIGWVTIPHLVNNFLPEYAPGIKTAQIAVIGSLTFAYSGPSVIIPILRRNIPSQIVGVLSIGLVWLGGIIAIEKGFGIEGVAVVRILANGLYGIFVLTYVFYLTGKDIKPE